MDATLGVIIGTIIGGTISFVATFYATRTNIVEARKTAEREYLHTYMSQLVAIRSEFNQLLMTNPLPYENLVKTVSTAASIAKALGDNEISQKFQFNGELMQSGLPIIDEVIDLVRIRLDKIV